MLAVTLGSQVFNQSGLFLRRGLVHFALDIMKRNGCRFVMNLAYCWFDVFLTLIVINLDTALDNSNYVSEVDTSQIRVPIKCNRPETIVNLEVRNTLQSLFTHTS